MTAVDARILENERAEGLIDEFLGHLRHVRRLSPHTVRAYETDLRSYLDWCEREGVVATRPDRRVTRRYLTSLVNARYADKTVNRHLSAMRTFFSWIQDHGEEIDESVLAMHGRKLTKSLPKVMSDDDVRRLVSVCDDATYEGLRDHAMVELMYATGARVSEIAGLAPSDIDYTQGEVRLFGKGSKERIVPIYDVALDVTKKYVEEARPSLAANRKKPGVPESLFVSVRGNDMTANALRARFERIARLAGIEIGVTPHAVRHTYATELLDGGADLRTVQELLGHESMATTQIYTHLSVERLKDATRRAHPRG